MDLFNDQPTSNLLPYDGEVIYFGKIFSKEKADAFTQLLLKTIAWKNDEVVIFGKHLVMQRKVAWYADQNYYYTYSNTTKQASIWTKELLEIKFIVEKKTGAAFNACLLNLYHNGAEGMSWHSDDESTMGKINSIASLSFGAERKFSLKHKRDKIAVSLLLEQGSLLLMKGETQSHWMHSLPKTTRVSSPRINLTFRTIIGQ